MEFDDDDDENIVGELIEREYLSTYHSEIVTGDLVHFRIRHKALNHLPEMWEAIGFIRAVFPGYELVYEVDVVKQSKPEWRLLVRREDILQAWVP